MMNEASGNPSTRARIAIADPQTLFREGVSSLLTGYPHIVVVGSTSSPASVLEMCAECRPDVLIMAAQVAMELPSSGLERLQEASPNTRLLLLVDHPNHPSGPMFAAQTDGVLRRTDSTERLIKSIVALANGKSLDGTDGVGARSQRRGRHGLLSERENDIARLVSQGLSNREISDQLKLSEQSVKNIVSRILKKLGLTNRVQIAMRSWTG